MIELNSILLWKSKTLANSFTLKIAEQRYVGMIRTDRRGETYWKFKEYRKKNPSGEVKEIQTAELPSEQSLPRPENQPTLLTESQKDNIVKFQERQAKAQQIQSRNFQRAPYYCCSSCLSCRFCSYSGSHYAQD